jgi:hypothetical protein
MTDYRLRNPNLLYAARGNRPLDWRTVAILGVIAVVVTAGVVGHLAERFNAAIPDSTIAQQPGPVPAVQIATPGAARSGS